MRIFSTTRTIVAPAAAAGHKLGGTAPMYHPPGTILELDDAEAGDLIGKGIAVQYDEDAHGAARGGRIALPQYGGSVVETGGAVRE